MLRAGGNGKLRYSLTLLTALAALGCADTNRPNKPASLFITNVRIVDGTGEPAYEGSVRVENGVVVAIGLVEPHSDDVLSDGRGQVLAPGFIDTHSHADRDLSTHADAIAAISQGITTVIVGQDGRSEFPLSELSQRIDAEGAAINVASYIGHNTIRELVMGDDYRRPAQIEEISAMRTLLRNELRSGALGLSTGLEYEPGLYSNAEEVLALAKLTAREGGRYSSHLRSEDRHLEAAVEELLEIGRVTNMPVHISHFKLAMKTLWGRGPELLARLQAARQAGIDVTADVYPYPYWQSTMMVLLPERDARDRDAVEFALEHLAPADGIWFTRYTPNPRYVGMTLTAIATELKTDAVSAFTRLAIDAQEHEAQTGNSAEAVIGTSMHPDDIRTLLSWAHSNVATDGGLADLHPRAFGTYAHILGRFVREEMRMTLEEAVHKMSGLAARHMGITERGLIRVGQAADLILFDPETIIDHATPEHPNRLSEGITAVWINGELVFLNGRATGARPGKFLRRGRWQH